MAQVHGRSGVVGGSCYESWAKGWWNIAGTRRFRRFAQVQRDEVLFVVIGPKVERQRTGQLRLGSVRIM